MNKYIARTILLFAILSFSFVSNASGDEWILGFLNPAAYLGRLAELTRHAAVTERFDDLQNHGAAELAEEMALQVLDDDCVELSEEACEETCSDEGTSSCQQSSDEENHDPKFKTELCRYFEKHGHCSLADSCRFAHGAAELRLKHEKCKTELCRSWLKTGLCRYGKRCLFAHGKEELRKKYP